jgi:dienelactone hydrolase
LLAPNIDNSPQAWDALYDHPEWIRNAIDTLSQTYPVDKHRLYLWGYSAGGMFTFYFAFLESRYFAAAAVHGGVIEDSKYQMADFAVRKIPLAYFIGTRDQWWTTKQSRASRDALLARHFEVHYMELAGADHNFFARSARSPPMPGNFSSNIAWTTNPASIRWT